MKKTRTLSSRLATIFIGGMALAILAGGITTYFVQDKIVDDLTNARLKNSVYESSKPIEEAIFKAESAVEGAEFTTESNFTSPTQLADDAFVTSALAKIQDFYEQTAKHTDAISGYWIVLNPQYTGLTPEDPKGDGFFFVKNSNGEFENKDVTNVLKYQDDDSEHIAWWTSVKDTKQPNWMDPYYNANTGHNMFSYVRPFFASDSEKTFLGAVGIDIDLETIINYINTFDDYEDAHSILLNRNGKVIYHMSVKTFDENGHYIGTDLTLKDIAGFDHFKLSDEGAFVYRYEGRRRNAMSIGLPNGMTYGFSVRTGELRKPLRMVTFIPQLVYIGAAAIIIFLVQFLVRRHILPLKELSKAVEKIEKGEMDVKIESKQNDEIGNLANSFSHMVGALKEKNKMISAMAFLDGLTGVKNKNAHRETVRRLDKEISEGTAKFAIVMLDVNNLKMINDNLGHDGGDKVIIGSCYTLCKAFSHSPVYRIGGDEFVAIIEGEDYENRQEIFDKLVKKEIDVKHEKYDYAVGMATFDPASDKCFKDVFNRADEEMYLNKKASKIHE